MSPSTSRYVTLGAFFPPFPVGLLSYPGADRYRVSRCSFRGYKRCLFQNGDCVSLPVFTPLLHRGDNCLLAGGKESYSASDFPVPVPQILRSRYDLGRVSLLEVTAGSQPQGLAEADPRWGTFKCVAGL